MVWNKWKEYINKECQENYTNENHWSFATFFYITQFEKDLNDSEISDQKTVNNLTQSGRTLNDINWDDVLDFLLCGVHDEGKYFDNYHNRILNQIKQIILEGKKFDTISGTINNKRESNDKRPKKTQ